MTSSLFPLHICLGFAAGWLLVSAVTYVIEKYGAGPAGLVGALPSTAALNLFFIGATQTKDAAIQSTSVFPLSFSITFGFLLFFAYPQRTAFVPRLAIALTLWFLLELLLAISHFDDFNLALPVSIIASSAVYLAYRGRGIRNARPIEGNPEIKRVAAKGVLGGVVVGAVVFFSAIAGPLVGGVVGAAPALWGSSLIANRAEDIEVSRSLAKSFSQVGMLTIIPYYVAVRYVLYGVNTGLGPAVDVGLAILWGYVAISPLILLAWRTTKKTQREAGVGNTSTRV